MSKKADVKAAVADGNYDTDDIAATAGLSTGGTNYHLRNLMADGEIVRVKPNGVYRYYTPDSPELEDYDSSEIEDEKPGRNDGGENDDESQEPQEGETVAQPAPATTATESQEGDGGDDPMDVRSAGASNLAVMGGRSYDWADWEPEGGKYYQSRLELSKLKAYIQDAVDGKIREPSKSIEGPTGCGKTSMVEVAAEEAIDGVTIPVFELNCHPELNTLEMFGKDMAIGNEFAWQDKPVAQAVLCSRDRPCILLVDEVNRSRPAAQNALFGVLDHRCRLPTGRGDEVIQGNRQNLIVISTLNIGPEFTGTEKMDAAQKRRYGGRLAVDYLGKSHPKKEMELVCEETPAGPVVAERLVTVANEVRQMADRGDLRESVPTANVLGWAEYAATCDRVMDGAEEMSVGQNGGSMEVGPIAEAAIEEVIRPIYGMETSDGEKVRNVIIESNFGDAPFGETEYVEWFNEGGKFDIRQQIDHMDVNWADYGYDEE